LPNQRSSKFFALRVENALPTDLFEQWFPLFAQPAPPRPSPYGTQPGAAANSFETESPNRVSPSQTELAPPLVLRNGGPGIVPPDLATKPPAIEVLQTGNSGSQPSKRAGSALRPSRDAGPNETIARLDLFTTCPEGLWPLAEPLQKTNLNRRGPHSRIFFSARQAEAHRSPPRFPVSRTEKLFSRTGPPGPADKKASKPRLPTHDLSPAGPRPPGPPSPPTNLRRSRATHFRVDVAAGRRPQG